MSKGEAMIAWDEIRRENPDFSEHFPSACKEIHWPLKSCDSFLLSLPLSIELGGGERHPDPMGTTRSNQFSR